MTTTASISVNRFKEQAKKLKEFLGKSGKEVSHSLCLEAISVLSGYKNWNVASAKANEQLKLFLVCCTFDRPEDDNNTGEFQYLLRAKSAKDVESVCAREFPKLLTKGDAFRKWTAINIFDIIEIEEVSEDGVLINWALIKTIKTKKMLGSSRISNALPFGHGDCKLNIYQWTSDDPDGSRPFVTL